MSSGFQQPITIKNAIDNIYNRKYLLPAIQRKFTWSSNQIEMLFDSIMRGYPINSFMFWKITDSGIKSGYKFYEFITEFREFFAENNRNIENIIKDSLAYAGTEIIRRTVGDTKVLELTSLENSEKKLELERSLINKAISMIIEN